MSSRGSLGSQLLVLCEKKRVRPWKMEPCWSESSGGQAFGLHILTPLPIRTLSPEYGYNVTSQRPDLATSSSLLAAMSSLSMTDHIPPGQRARKLI